MKWEAQLLVETADRARIEGERGACGSSLKRITSKSFHAKTGGGDRGQGSRSAGSAYSRESRALLLCSRSPDGSVSELDAIMCSR